MRRYRVRIPVEAITLATTQASTSYGLNDGLRLDDVLRVHVEPATKTTYLEQEVIAQNRDSATAEALPVARRCVQLLALLHDMGFVLSLVGIQVETIEDSGQQSDQWDENGIHHIALHDRVEVSDYWSIRASLATFDELGTAWRTPPPPGDLGDAAALALEWVYLGKVAPDDRNAFLAFWVALELLIEGADKAAHATAAGEGAPTASTVIGQEVTSKEDRKRLRDRLDALLANDIPDAGKRKRIVDYAFTAKAESDVDRWTRLLRTADVPVTEDEMRQLRNARSSIVHSGAGGLPTARLREIVIAYLKKVLGLAP